MPKACATIATTSTEEPKNPGTALTISFTPMACARIATSTLTIAKEEKKEPKNDLAMWKFKASSK